MPVQVYHLWVQVISIDGFARRNRFILAVSLGLGLGVTLVPGWAEVRLMPNGFQSLLVMAFCPLTDVGCSFAEQPLASDRWNV
jgi:xanthine/uracil permease